MDGSRERLCAAAPPEFSPGITSHLCPGEAAVLNEQQLKLLLKSEQFYITIILY